MRHTAKIFGLVCLLVMILASPIYAETTGGRVRIGGNLNVPVDTVVQGDAVTIFGSQVIDGEVNGTIVSVFGDVELSGEVSQDVVAVFGDVILKEGAHIDGDLVNIIGETERQGAVEIGGEEVTMDAGEIGQQIRDNIHLENIRFSGFFTAFHWPLWGFLVSLLWTVVIALLFPKHLQNIAGAIENDAIHVGVRGILGTIGVVIVVVLLTITILGIPIAVLVGLLTWLAVAFGSVAIYYLIGDRLAEQFQWETSVAVKTLLGTVLLGLVMMLPLGGIVKFFLGILGLGGVMVTKFGNRQPWIE